jgi:hypothetical protein
VLDAEDQLALAHGVLERLREELRKLHAEQWPIEVRIFAARNAIVAPVIERLTEEVITGHARLAVARSALAVLAGTWEDLPEGLPQELRHRAREQIAGPIQELNGEIWQARVAGNDHGPERRAMAERVTEALSAMLENGNAELPEI